MTVFVDKNLAADLGGALKRLSCLLKRLQAEHSRLRQNSDHSEVLAILCSGKFFADNTQLTLWFGTVAATLLSSQKTGLSEIHRINPDLTEKRLDLIQSVVAACMFTVVNLSHVRRCVSNTEELVMTIQNMLERQVMSFWRKKHASKKFVPSDEMVRYAVKRNNPDLCVLKAVETLENFYSSLELLEKKIKREISCSRKRRNVALLAFHAASFEYESAHEIISNTDKCKRMLELSSRGCYMDGQQLLSLPECLQCWPRSMSEEADIESLAATVNLLQHKAESLATNLVAKRTYTHEDLDTGKYSYDPRFLIFEVIAFYALACTNPLLVCILSPTKPHAF